LTDQYRSGGDAFYAPAGDEAQQRKAYYGPGGLYETFSQIKDVSGEILHINQSNMERTGQKARRVAELSLIWFGGGLVLAIFLAGLSAWHTVRTILQPIQALTRAAQEISAGNPDQVVPYVGRDELDSSPRRLTRWPITCATIASRNRPSSSAPSRRSRRRSIRSPTLSS